MRSLMGAAHGRGGKPIANLIHNGSFVGHADGWYGVLPNTAADFSAGHLAVVATNEGATYSEVWYRPAGAAVVSLGGLTGTLDVAGVAWSDDESAIVQVIVLFSIDALISDGGTVVYGAETPIGPTSTAFAERGIAIPDGATHFQLTLHGPLTVAYDNVYAGEPAADSPPYPTASVPPLPANRINNSDFETGIQDWNPATGNEVLTHEIVTPLVGTGSLAVATSGSSKGVASPPWGAVVVAGETLRFRCALICPLTVRIDLIFNGSGGATIYQAVPSNDPNAPTMVDVTAEVPAGDTVTQVYVRITGNHVSGFTLDAVSLGSAP